jgi:hypothetical protein
MHIPKGDESRFGRLVCRNITVNGILCAEGEIRAKRIDGNGIIRAGAISADSVAASDIDAGTIVADRLIAKRVTAGEIHAAHEMAVSSYLEADYVKTGRITMGDNVVSELEADEIIKLSPKPRGLLRTLLASFVRSKFAALFLRTEQREKGKIGADDEPAVTLDVPADAESEAREKPVAADAPRDGDLKMISAMYELMKSGDYTWKIVPKERTARTGDENDANPFAAGTPEDEAA